jgi:hypothetical protein
MAVSIRAQKNMIAPSHQVARMKMSVSPWRNVSSPARDWIASVKRYWLGSREFQFMIPGEALS